LFQKYAFQRSTFYLGGANMAILLRGAVQARINGADGPGPHNSRFFVAGGKFVIMISATGKFLMYLTTPENVLKFCVA
jgi:hypothetical protein